MYLTIYLSIYTYILIHHYLVSWPTARVFVRRLELLHLLTPALCWYNHNTVSENICPCYCTHRLAGISGIQAHVLKQSNVSAYYWCLLPDFKWSFYRHKKTGTGVVLHTWKKIKNLNHTLVLIRLCCVTCCKFPGAQMHKLFCNWCWLQRGDLISPEPCHSDELDKLEQVSAQFDPSNRTVGEFHTTDSNTELMFQSIYGAICESTGGRTPQRGRINQFYQPMVWIGIQTRIYEVHRIITDIVRYFIRCLTREWECKLLRDLFIDRTCYTELVHGLYRGKQGILCVVTSLQG